MNKWLVIYNVYEIIWVQISWHWLIFFLIIILPDTNSPPDAFILMIKVSGKVHVLVFKIMNIKIKDILQFLSNKP